MHPNYVQYPNINYIMPFMFANDIWILILNHLFNSEKNPIKQVYGSVYCAWQSGRHAKVFQDDFLIIDEYLSNLVNLGLIPTFTFSTLNIDNEKLNDNFSNQLLDIAYKYDSYFIVASDLLYKHIKSRYNNAKMICSVIAPSVRYFEYGFNETEFYNKMLEKYEQVVIRPEYILENINNLDKKISDISRIEVLINQTCFYNCPYQQKHYALQEENDFLFKNYGTKIEENINEFCPRYTIPNEKYRSVKMNFYQIQQLVDMGVKNFKLQGRDGNVQNLFNDLYEFVINQKISKEELKSIINNLSAEIVLRRKSLQYLYLVK